MTFLGKFINLTKNVVESTNDTIKTICINSKIVKQQKKISECYYNKHNKDRKLEVREAELYIQSKQSGKEYPEKVIINLSRIVPIQQIVIQKQEKMKKIQIVENVV